MLILAWRNPVINKKCTIGEEGNVQNNHSFLFKPWFPKQNTFHPNGHKEQ